MRARRLMWIATSCILVLLATGVAMASGAGIASEQTIVLYSETAKAKHVDLGNPGPSAFDQDIFFDTLFSDPEKTDQVGMDRVTCTYLPSSYVMCIDEFTLTGRGKIVTSGTLHFNASFEDGGDSLVVSGGTGEFEGVRGAALLEFFDAETFKNTIHLLP
jgi:hypothetical protein